MVENSYRVVKRKVFLEMVLKVDGVDGTIFYFHSLWYLVFVILYILTWAKTVLRSIVVLTLLEELEKYFRSGGRSYSYTRAALSCREAPISFLVWKYLLFLFLSSSSSRR
jgi:hypothetical protein